MAVEIYATPIEAAVVSSHGWARLPSGMWVTKLPLIDARTITPEMGPVLFARLGYNDARAVAKRYGARLIAPATLIELNRVGVRIEPVILPPDSLMSSRARCVQHDVECFQRLLAAGWNAQPSLEPEERPTMNVGKQQVQDPSMDLNRDGDNSEDDETHLMGWSKHKRSSALTYDAAGFADWYQPLMHHGHKGRKQRDYGTLCTLERDSAPDGLREAA